MSVLESASVKCLGVVGVLFGATLHTAAFQGLPAPATESDMLRYGMTQGGLLAVALVLLYVYRRDVLGQISRKDDKLEYLAELVRTNTAAMERMAAAVEHLDERRRAPR
jgi:hypothetical protein